MKFKDHCERARATFGRPYSMVHKWLDEFAGRPPYGMRHRRLRHHEEGIREVRQKWGEEASKVARQHIEDDLKLEGWKETDSFPKNETDYVRMGFY